MDLENPPETLVSLLGQVAEQYAAEYAAHHACCDQWVAQQPDDVIKSNRPVGMTQFELRGTMMPDPVKACRHFLSQRMTDVSERGSKEAHRLSGLFSNVPG